MRREARSPSSASERSKTPMVRQQQLARRVECHRRTQHTRSATSRRRYMPIFISCHISAGLSGFCSCSSSAPRVRPMVVQLTADESEELHAGDKGRRAQVRSLCVAQPRPCSRVSAAGPPRAPAARRGATSRCCPPSRRRHCRRRHCRRYRGRLRLRHRYAATEPPPPEPPCSVPPPSPLQPPRPPRAAGAAPDGAGVSAVYSCM